MYPQLHLRSHVTLLQLPKRLPFILKSGRHHADDAVRFTRDLLLRVLVIRRAVFGVRLTHRVYEEDQNQKVFGEILIIRVFSRRSESSPFEM